jgi:hypothetical protein
MEVIRNVTLMPEYLSDCKILYKPGGGGIKIKYPNSISDERIESLG